MEFFRFIKWQWNRFSPDDKLLIFLVIILLVFIPTAIYYSLSFIVIVASSVGITVALALLSLLYNNVKTQWYKYTKFKDAEAREIMDRLSGKYH